MKNGHVKIEKGIQLPDRGSQRKRPMVVTLEKMKDGDSFLYPMLKRTELSYCARKASVVIATGISGATAATIRQRFEQEIHNGSPSYVHIMAGTNDIYGLGKWDASTVDSVSSMVSEARALHLRVIVGTIPPLDGVQYPALAAQVAPYNAAVIAAVKPQGAFIADYYSAMILPNGMQNAALFVDGVHPNDAGYQVMHRVLRETKREMWQATTTPEQRSAWRAAHPRHHQYTAEQRSAWRAAHPR